jgi:hypothetical protein
LLELDAVLGFLPLLGSTPSAFFESKVRSKPSFKLRTSKSTSRPRELQPDRAAEDAGRLRALDVEGA